MKISDKIEGLRVAFEESIKGNKYPQTMRNIIRMSIKAKETAAETEAQRGAGLQLKGEGGVVQLQLFQCILQVGVLGTVGGVDAAEHHGLDLTVAGQRLRSGAVGQRDGIAHAGYYVCSHHIAVCRC